MASTIRSKIHSLKELLLSPKKAWGQLIVVFVLTLLSISAFLMLVGALGTVASVFLTLPVVAAGWFFGPTSGLTAGILVSGLNLFLLTQFTDNTLQELAIFWPGFLALIASGYLVGYLYEVSANRMHLRDEFSSSERFLSLMGIATESILNTKNLDEAYYRLISHLANLFVADYAYLTRWDETLDQVTLVAATKSTNKTFQATILDPAEARHILKVLHSRKTLVIDDVPNSNAIINPNEFKDLSLPTQSALVIPVMIKDFRFGAVILAYDSPQRFSTIEVQYVELACKQIALALWTIQQHLVIEKQLNSAQALAKIERTLSESEQVGSETIFQLIVDSVVDLIPDAKYVVLHLLDEEEKLLIPRAVAGYTRESKSNLYMRLGEGVAGQVIESGQIVTIADVRSDSRFLKPAGPISYRSLVVAPIQSNDRCIGTISAQSDNIGVFGEEEGALLSSLGTQASIAITNANLLETTREDLKEINTLYQLTRNLATLLDPDELLQDAVDLLQKTFGYYQVQIFLIDPASENLTAHSGAGAIANQLSEEGFSLPAGSGILGHVAETGEPFYTNDVNQVVFFDRNPLLPDTQSEMALPITAAEKVLGVLDIQETDSRSISDRQMKLMRAVTHQLSIALQNAHLYTDLEDSLQQEKSMRAQLLQSERLAMVGRLLASVSHELNNPLQAIQNALFLLKDEENLSSQGFQDLDVILAETDHMASLIGRLRATYRPATADEFQHLQLNDIVEDVHALTTTYMRHRNISFKFSSEPDLPPMKGIPEQIRQVILNLFMNAIDAMPTRGKLFIQTESLPDQNRILLSVTDSGAGIDPDIFSDIFEPFISSKHSGTGLGLTITRDIVVQHQGEIQAENNPKGGATFKIWLPVAEE